MPSLMSTCQVLLRDTPVCVQQVDVLKGILRLPVSSLRLHAAHVCPVPTGCTAQGGLAAQVSPGTLALPQGLRVSSAYTASAPS